MIRLISCLLMTALSAVAVAQVKPNAPSSLCVQDTSGTSSCVNVASTGGAKKWNPGDYYRANEQAFAYQRAARNWVWDKVKADPLVKGGLLVVPWGTVDKGNGVYDFSEIDADLATLKASGKRLIIEVWWMNYWHSLSSARGSGWVPDYTIDNGCAVPAAWDSGSTAGVGYTIQLHLQKCMDNLISFYAALAKRYDGDPNVEQIIITEPSTPYATWDATQYLVQFKRLVAAVGQSWPKTTAVFYMNWFAQPGEMAAATAAAGLGIGGPDLLPSPREDDGGKALRGSFGGNYGTTDYRGKIPVSYSFETCCTVTASQADAFAINSLKATHLAWVIQSGDPGYTLADVQAVIKARSGKTTTAYPTSLPK